MANRIIVAGGGHGGIAAAALLAANGFEVTVYEKKKEGTLGYDWTDIFAPGALEAAGIPMPPADKFSYKTDMTFYSPAGTTALRQHVPEDELEIKMERKDIYALLIEHAVKKGVRFKYECEVLSPIMSGSRVIGIHTDKGDFHAPMVIDACGIDSPVRRRLPPACGIEKGPGKIGQFIVYRAFYNKCGEEKENPYKVYMMPAGRLGIGWVATEENFTDLLVGGFDTLTQEDVDIVAAELRRLNPQLGTELQRGGEFVKIPVRQPLAVMVADGYAAIGDSAFMTVPVIGSGIANSLKAARMLADTIVEDEDHVYTCETLWKYQRRYYKAIGSGLAPLACAKLLLTKLWPTDMDYLFDNGILTADDLTIGANSTNLASFLSVSPASLPPRAKGLLRRPVLARQIFSCGAAIAKVIATTSVMPQHWDRRKVFSWATQYCQIFRKYRG